MQQLKDYFGKEWAVAFMNVAAFQLKIMQNRGRVFIWSDELRN